MKNEINWFKGSRKYIQAADLVHVAFDAIEHITQFDFASRKVASHPVLWVKAGSVAKEDILATFSAQTIDAQKIELVAVQDISRQISRADSFEEALMFELANIEGGRLECPLLPNFSVWEHISSLNKHLLTQMFGHSSWWFVRLEGNANMYSRNGIITIRYMEKKKIFYRSEVLINNQLAGIVDFAMR